MTPVEFAWLAWAVVVLYVPGAVLIACRIGLRTRLLLAGSPAVTFAVLYIASVVTGLTGLPWNGWVVLVALLVLAATCLVLGRRDGSVRARLTWSAGRPGWGQLLTAVGVVAACVLATVTHIRGMGGLGTLPQEHDTVLHNVIVAHIARTGLAAPWQAFPADVMTGQPAAFYPDGLHQFAALVSLVTPDTVTGLNTAGVALFAWVLPVGVALLASLLRPAAWRGVIAVTAAGFSAVAYRPVIAMLHDGGIMANAAAFSLAAGVVSLVVVSLRAPRPTAAPLALAATGAVIVHPTSIVVVGLTAGAWAITECARRPWTRGDARVWLWSVARTLLVTALMLVPFVVAASRATGTVTSWPRDFPVSSLTQAIGTTTSASYGGFLDPTLSLSQSWIAGLAVLGVVACLVTRTNLPLLVTYVAWSVLLLLFLLDRLPGPLATVAGVFYNSYVRLQGPVGLTQWLAAAVATGAACALVERTVRALPAVRARRTGVLRPALAVLAVAGLAAVVFVPYAHVNISAISARYSHPDFVRVSNGDLAAARFVASRLGPGERVMNSANDGSTFGYALYGLPVVETNTLAASNAPYTVELFLRFDDLATDRDVAALVCRLDITYAIADSAAQFIGGPRDVFPYLVDGGAAVPPGLDDLDGSPALIRIATFGTTGVFEVRRDLIGCN